MAGTNLINLMSYSCVLAQSQRFFIASKPTRLSLIFKFLTEFPTDVLKKIWTIHRFTGDMSVPQCYHWNHPEIHSHIGNVVSTTLEYDHINGTSSSYDDVVRRSSVPVTGNLFITRRWLPKNSISQTQQSLYHLVAFFWETFYSLLHYHFNFWLSLSLSDSLSETLSWTLKSGLRPKFNLTSV